MLAVYKIQCTVTGMYYIGSTHFLHTRLGAHRAALRRGTHDNSKLQRAWNKYGHAAFVFEHVASPLNAALLGPLEQTLIDTAMAEGCAFNLNRDVARPRLGAVNSAETRQRISAAKRGFGRAQKRWPRAAREWRGYQTQCRGARSPKQQRR